MVADSVRPGNTLLPVHIAVPNVRFIFSSADGWVLPPDIFLVRMNFTGEEASPQEWGRRAIIRFDTTACSLEIEWFGGR
jgi:hypothetical protein